MQRSVLPWCVVAAVLTVAACAPRLPPPVRRTDLITIGGDVYRATTAYRMTPFLNETLRPDLTVAAERPGLRLAFSASARDDGAPSECGAHKPVWRRDDVRIEPLASERGAVAIRWSRRVAQVPQGERRVQTDRGCVREEFRWISAWTRLEARLRRLHGGGDLASHGKKLLITRLDTVWLAPEAHVQDTLGRAVPPVAQATGGALYAPPAADGLEIVVAQVDSYPPLTAAQVRTKPPCIDCLTGWMHAGGAHVTDLDHAIRRAGFVQDGAPSGFARFTMRMPRDSLLKPLRGVLRQMDLWYCEDFAGCRAPIGSPTFAGVSLSGTPWDVVLSFVARRRRSALSTGWERETRVRAHYVPAFRDGYFVLERLTDLEVESLHDEEPLAGLREPLLNAQGYHLFGVWADGIRRERRYRSTCLTPVPDGVRVLGVSTSSTFDIELAAPISLQEPSLCPR